MAENFMMIESAAFKTIMDKIDRIEKFILEVWEENKKGKTGPVRLLTGKEVTSILRISKQTLWRMRDRGDIQFIKQGNICLYTQKEVESVMERKLIRRRRHFQYGHSGEMVE